MESSESTSRSAVVSNSTTETIGPLHFSARAEPTLEQLLTAHRQELAGQYVGAAAAPINSMGILGCGVMGTAIAASAVGHGISVVLSDVDEALRSTVVERIAKFLAEAGIHLTRETLHRRVRATADPAELGRAGLVLETIVEDRETKQRVYRSLEPHLTASTVLCSNTSTLPISSLANGLVHPQRFCGLHFFYPVYNRPLVEVIPGRQTDPRTVAAVVAFGERIGKVPMVVRDCCGFLVNRLLKAYVGESQQLMMEGVSPRAIDQAAEQFGMARGPVRMLDEIGLDTALNCACVLAGAFPELTPNSPLLMAMVKAGRLGRKSGAGFYAYRTSNGDEPRPEHDPAADAIIARWSGPRQTYSPERIVVRLLLAMLLEATRLLAEGTARSARAIDLGMALALGFPAVRSGLLVWADGVGTAEIVQWLRPLEALGPRLRPTKLLLEMAARNRRFHE